MDCIYADFVEVKNKWKEINSRYSKCCSNKCITKNKPIGKCIEGNGFVNIFRGENIKYLVGKRGFNKYVVVSAENSFNKPQNCLNYSLYYFEVKCKFEGELDNVKWMNIGLKNLSTNKHIIYSANHATFYNEKKVQFQLPKLHFNNNNIYGCGLVYPPTDKLKEEFPYVFFTQNGKQIG